jgi:hypothetical protein
VRGVLCLDDATAQSTNGPSPFGDQLAAIRYASGSADPRNSLTCPFCRPSGTVPPAADVRKYRNKSVDAG